MIYVLMQQVDYEDNDVQIFASTSKSKVEDKHEELLKRNHHFETIFKYVKARVEALDKNTPPIIEPKYTELPPRPLVWQNDKWNNAYGLEYTETVRKQNELRSEEVKKILVDLGDYFSVPIEQMEEIWGYAYPKTYHIEEVESD